MLYNKLLNGKNYQATINKKRYFFLLMFVLCLGYTLSQFLRTSIGVLAPELMNNINLSHENMGFLGGVFFLSFALFQIPSGILLDRFGPRRVMSIVILLAFLGSVIFAMSDSYQGLLIARIFMGLGCSICLMGSLVLITMWAPSNFSILAGTILAIGGLGGLLATTPLSILSELHGWRSAFWISASITSLIAILYYSIIRDRPSVLSKEKINKSKDNANILKVIKQRDFKFMVPMSLMSYSALVVVLGLWGAPYLKDVQGLNVVERGQVLMLMAISWNIGSFIFGYLNRILGGYKRVVIFGAIGTILCLIVLSFIPELEKEFLYIFFCIFGFFGAFSVALLAHYQSLHDKENMGKALTTANFFNFGGVFLMQWISGKIIYYVNGGLLIASKQSYICAFIFVAFCLFIALIIYMFSNEEKITQE